MSKIAVSTNNNYITIDKNNNLHYETEDCNDTENLTINDLKKFTSESLDTNDKEF